MTIEWSDLYGRCAFRLPNLTATHQSFYTLHNACNTLRDRHAAGHAFLLLIRQRAAELSNSVLKGHELEAFVQGAGKVPCQIEVLLRKQYQGIL